MSGIAVEYDLTDPSSGDNRIRAVVARLADERQWTVTDLATHTGTDLDLMHRILDANARINTEDLCRFAKAFDIGFLELVRMIDREPLPVECSRRLTENGRDTARRMIEAKRDTLLENAVADATRHRPVLRLLLAYARRTVTALEAIANSLNNNRREQA